MKKKIGIIGAGWLGLRVAKVLANRYTIYSTKTSADKLPLLEQANFHPTLVHFLHEPLAQTVGQWPIVNELDALLCTVHIADRKSTPTEIAQRIQHLANFIGDFKGTLLFTSSTSVYPNRQEVFQESDLPVTEVFGEALVKKHFPQATILRLAGLMGDDRFLAKYAITQLEQPVNHIHYTDIAQLIDQLLDTDTQNGLYNVVAPLHPSKDAVIAAQKQHACTFPIFPEGRIISCDKLLQELKFSFQFPDPRLFYLSPPTTTQ